MDDQIEIETLKCIWQEPRVEEQKRDIVVKEDIYRDCKIKILQDAATIGGSRPTYYALSSLPNEHGTSGRPIGIGSEHASTESIEELKRAAEAYIDKRIRWQEMRRSRKAVQ
jgi:hypothetical protein